MENETSGEAQRHKQLLTRINKNYSDFWDSMMTLDKSEIITNAHKIADTYYAFKHMSNIRNLSIYEMDFLLKFINPLEVVADYLNCLFGEFKIESVLDECIREICDTEDALVDYPLVDEEMRP